MKIDNIITNNIKNHKSQCEVAASKITGALVEGGNGGVSIDTRTLNPGDIFVAIRGQRFDGHDFIDLAIERGASLVIASQYNNLDKKKLLCPILIVSDTLKALGELASLHRMDFEVPIIGITGSNGKTTVKAMLGSIFSQNKSALVTQHNFNNEIGLPLTLLKLNQQHQAVILEMGARHVGDLRYLCNIAKPTISLITNVMPAHLECFGSLSGVAQAKGEIYEGLSEEGIAVLNTDLFFTDYFKTLIGKRKCVSFGLNGAHNPDITVNNIEFSNQSTRFILVTPLGNRMIVCPTQGMHNVMNALAASSVAFAAGLSLEEIAEGLAQFSGVSGRLQYHTMPLGSTLIDDSYNANPGSFEAAIEVLAQSTGPKILVMGDMGELGETASALHEKIGQFARTRGIDRLFAVGSLVQHAVKAFGQGAQLYETKASLVDDLKAHLACNTTCLIKGSRSTQMETVVQALLNNQNNNQTNNVGGY